VESSARDVLVNAWKGWVEQAVAESGTLPPGNTPGETKWQSRKAAPLKKEIRLTAGKAINVTIDTLIEQVVKTNKVLGPPTVHSFGADSGNIPRAQEVQYSTCAFMIVLCFLNRWAQSLNGFYN